MKNQKELLQETLSMIDKMSQNTYLLPNGWSDKIEMSNFDWCYKTYVSESTRSKIGRYINIDIYNENNDKTNEFLIRSEKIEVSHVLGQKPIDIKTVNFYISEIFKEKHSFENHVEGVKPLKVKIKRANEQIKSYQKDIEDYKNQIEDLKKLTH
jgi:hypothetical protein